MLNKYEWIINNVTLVMPHAEIVAVVQDLINKILQSQNLNVRFWIF